jgi:dTDP-glucose pyrophosphorylase
VIDFKKHLTVKGSSIKEALAKLNELAADAILFVTGDDGRLLGSLTDGDVRRGFLRGLSLEHKVEDFIQPNPRFIRKGSYSIEQVIEYRKKSFKVIPVIDKEDNIVNVINFRFFKSYLPIDAVIMAGGRGERLKPLTDTTPKPLLKIGDKPIIEHNIDRLTTYGIDDFWISIRYLGNQIEDYFKDGRNKGVAIDYIWEEEPLGTIGAVSTIDSFQHDYVLISNSDLLTNLDYEDFFLDFIQSEAALSVVTIPYSVNIPYAVLETSNGHVLSFKEKPTYTYYSNGGIYLVKREILEMLPKNGFFNATDLMELLISKNLKVNSYPLRGYWLDIGKPEDYKKAQEDIQHIRF